MNTLSLVEVEGEEFVARLGTPGRASLGPKG